jgi:topoisomerase IA-like protein
VKGKDNYKLPKGQKAEDLNFADALKIIESQAKPSKAAANKTAAKKVAVKKTAAKKTASKKTAIKKK